MRFRPQFGIRFLLVVTLILGVILAWIGNDYRRTRNAVAAINEVGGEVFNKSFTGYHWPFDTAHAVELFIDAEVGQEKVDRALSHLQAFPELECLYLSGKQINNHNLSNIKELEKLGILDIGMAHVDDDGLRHFKHLSQLQVLMLNGLPITNEGVVHLNPLWELRALGLRDTKVTIDGLYLLDRRGPLEVSITDLDVERRRRIRKERPDLILGIP